MRAISAKSSIISSRLLPTTPRHKLNKLGGTFPLFEVKNSAKFKSSIYNPEDKIHIVLVTISEKTTT